MDSRRFFSLSSDLDFSTIKGNIRDAKYNDDPINNKPTQLVFENLLN